MGRIYVPSTPASRGEKAPEPEPELMSREDLEAAAAAAGFALVPVEPEAPKGNAPREEWAEYAVNVKGAKPEDLVDDDGKELGRDELREKYGPKVDLKADPKTGTDPAK